MAKALPLLFPVSLKAREKVRTPVLGKHLLELMPSDVSVRFPVTNVILFIHTHLKFPQMPKILVITV